MTDAAFLLAYFLSEEEEDGEQVRFAVSDGPSPLCWTALNDGRPVLWSTIGTGGVRDPFLVRDEKRGLFVLIATDLRIWPDGNWDAATRGGSDSIIVWESVDLVSWDGPHRRRVSPDTAGNTWAPKAFWSAPRDAWLVFWASAFFEPGQERTDGTYQRIVMAQTRDFYTFSPAETYLDVGHDVIDVTFLSHAAKWYRFSANAHSPAETPDLGHHIFEEVGHDLEDSSFDPIAVDIGKSVMVRAEGPAVAADLTRKRWYLLADEFGMRGYQLFTTDDLTRRTWTHLPEARLPAGARHGSLLSISAEEQARLLSARWPV